MWVFSNSAMSLDGKLGTAAHDHVAIGSREDLRRMSVLRARADAVLVGGKTFRNWPLPLVEDPAAVRPGDTRLQRRGPVVNAVLTRGGVLPTGRSEPRFPDPRVTLLVMGPRSLDAEAHRRLLGAEVITTPMPTVAWALDQLEARGCRSVLVEGGGDLIAAVLETGRLTDLFVTLCPVLIGGAGSPTLLDGDGLAADQLRPVLLQSAEQVDGELFLHYTLVSDSDSAAS